MRPTAHGDQLFTRGTISGAALRRDAEGGRVGGLQSVENGFV